MPTIELHLIEGYDEATKRRIGETMTDAVRSIVPAPADGTVVLIHELKPGGYMRGRTAKPAAPALPNPCETVRTFLAAMEARDLETAQDLLAEGFEMTFPGPTVMHTLPELIAWAKPRYNWVKKSFSHVNAMPSPEGSIVFCSGTMYGQWPDGSDFEGIRFMDRFEIAGGKIIRQDVWNDMGETILRSHANA